MADGIQDLIQLVEKDTAKEFQALAVRQSVVDFPGPNEGISPAGPMVFNIAASADEFIPWGYNLKGRDRQLRGFWPSEPLLAAAVYSMAVRMAVMDWSIVGADPEKPRPKNTIRAVERMLRNADRGNGWQVFVVKVMTDVYTQDNGGFIELIRTKNRPDSPVIGIAHLDSARCFRTGNPEVPVIYLDRQGREHKMKWWNVVTVEDMPSPVETMYGAQLCAVSRALRAAQIIRDIAVYKKEKVSGQFARAVHFLSGLTRQNIQDALKLAEENAWNMNLTRYIQPIIVPTIDPQAQLNHVQVDLASLPDGFDEETTLKWYVTQLAITFGVDYQEFAPLAGGALGSGQQSEILHLKSRAKGPAMSIQIFEHIFNDCGIIPNIVKFGLNSEDALANAERAKARYERGRDRSLRVDSGELDIEGARQMAVLDGDVPIELVEQMDKRGFTAPRAADPLTSNQTVGGVNSQGGRMRPKVLLDYMFEQTE